MSLEINTELAILTGAALASIGWIYTARRARTLSKKQHTINVILSANFNNDFLKKREKIAHYVKDKTCPKEIINGQDPDLKAVFRDILNHYEFVSAGLRNGDFDEKLIKDSEKSTYISLFECCEDYIWSLRDNRHRMSIYEHLEWLHNRWQVKPPNRFIQICEAIRGKPFYGKLERTSSKK